MTRVVLVLVDGMRPDALLKAETPTIARLRERGASTLEARTVMPSMTLPCHMSLFHSVPPKRHGVTTNLYTPQVRPVPGLFEVLSGAGLTCAMFYTWEELRDVSRPGSLEHAHFLRDPQDGAFSADRAIAEAAAAWLGRNPFDFAFVYLGYTDVAGHEHGWMSAPYLGAVAEADACIGLVQEALSDDTLLIVMADHGGHDRGHGTAMPEDMTIPLIFSNHPDLEAAQVLPERVSIMDVAPTVAGVLGVAVPRVWEGRGLEIPLHPNV